MFLHALHGEPLFSPLYTGLDLGESGPQAQMYKPAFKGTAAYVKPDSPRWAVCRLVRVLPLP